MAQDYYAEAEAIASILEKDGQLAVASQLRDAMLDGFGATEILMILRHRSAEALERGHAGTEATRRRLEQLIKDINATIGV